MTSTDRISWTSTRLHTFDIVGGDPFIVSPAVVVSDNQYYMFHVQVDLAHFHTCSTPHQHHIEVMHSSDGLYWDISQNTHIDINLPEHFNPWHLDVVQSEGVYYMLITGYMYSECSHRKLYLATSTDLVHWHFEDNPIIEASADLYNSQFIYRSSAIIHGDDMFVYFSFRDNNHQWHLAIKRISIEKYRPNRAFLIPIIHNILFD